MFECAFKIIMFGFMKTIHIELSDKAIHFIMSEIFRENNFLKFSDIFDSELSSVRRPVYNFNKIGNLINSKIGTLSI